MKRNTQIIGYFVSITIMGILGLIMSNFFIDFLTSPDNPFPIPEEHLPGIMFAVTLKIVLSFMNMALFVMTLAIYIKIYRTLRTRFTLGLIVVILALLMNTMTGTPILQLRFGLQVVGPGLFFIIPDIFTFIALTVLFYLSME